MTSTVLQVLYGLGQQWGGTVAVVGGKGGGQAKALSFFWTCCVQIEMGHLHALL